MQVGEMSLDMRLEYTSVGHRRGHVGELMMAALEHLGFQVKRIAAWVLLVNQYQEGMPLNHNILWVMTEDDQMFICDPGLASASPR